MITAVCCRWSKIPADAFVDKSVLKSITDSERYDLAPTWENYYRLTDSGKGWALLGVRII